MRRLSFASALAVAAALGATPAGAVHFSEGAFVEAFAECDPMAANAMTSGGVPACAPAIPLSDCDADPGAALNLRGGTAFTYRNTGRRETNVNDGEVDILARAKLSGVERCDGSDFDGTLQVEMVLRVFREDPACSGGTCVEPDITITLPVSCERGKCDERFYTVPALLAAGHPPFPSDQPFTTQYVRVSVLDPAGRRFLTLGVQANNLVTAKLRFDPWKPSTWLARGGWQGWLGSLLDRITGLRDAFAYLPTSAAGARRVKTRYVQAFAPCDPGMTDTVTTEGTPACTPVPLSSCATDPANAVVAVTPVEFRTNDGRGKLDLKLKKSKSAIRVKGGIRGLESCAGEPYEGQLELRANVRATVIDPSCGTESCTAVDTPLFASQLAVDNGGLGVKVKGSLGELGPFPAFATTVNAEVIDLEVRDPSGNRALVGPATQVRCAPDPGGGGLGFCFGN